MAKDQDGPVKKLTTLEFLTLVAKLPSEERERVRRAMVRKYTPSVIINRSPEAAELEGLGWEPWLSELAPHVFRGSHARFHRDFWDWYWPLLLAKRDGIRLVALDVELAYLLTWARGCGKSTSVEWATIAMGALLGQSLVLYISSTAKLARNHLGNIREEIEGSQVEKYYPGLGNPQIGKFQNRYGWNQEMLSTRSGLTGIALGLEEEPRGLKKKNMRPSLLIVDEFDSKNDSPDVVLKKESILGGTIFPTGVEDTIILMAQNLIHGQSVATRTLKRRNQLLNHRRESGLIKAFSDDLEIKQEGTRWKVTRGHSTWAHFDEKTFQKFLDDSGPIEVFAEYQHQFDYDKSGRVLRNYRDKDEAGFTHVLTQDQFASVFGYRKPPPSWNKYVFHDKARTKTEWHAPVAGTLSMSSQNSPLPGITFLYDCLAFEEETPPEDIAVGILKKISPTVRVEGVEYQWEDLIRVLIARAGIDKFVTGGMREQISAQRSGLARVIPPHVQPLLTSQRYIKFRASHEADDVRRVLREVFGLPFEPANPPDGAGTELINLAMKVDENIPCPFRRHEGVMGFSRFYIIVPNNKIGYPNDNKPDALFDSDLARYQFTEHRWLTAKLNALGEMERGQEKKNDDFVNGLQFFYMDHSIMARELTEEERAEQMLRPEIQLATIEAITDPEEKEKAVYAREIALRRAATQQIMKHLASDGSGSKAGGRLYDYRRLARRGR